VGGGGGGGGWVGGGGGGGGLPWVEFHHRYYTNVLVRLYLSLSHLSFCFSVWILPNIVPASNGKAEFAICLCV